MTNKRLMKISPLKPDSGSVSGNYHFVFSDDISDWQRSKMSVSADNARKRYREKHNIPPSKNRRS